MKRPRSLGGDSAKPSKKAEKRIDYVIPYEILEIVWK